VSASTTLKLEDPAVLGLAGLRPIEARQPAFSPASCSGAWIPSALRCAPLAAHPGFSNTNLQGHSGRKLGDSLMSFGARLIATDADFGAPGKTLYAASQDAPGQHLSLARDSAYGGRTPAGRAEAGWAQAAQPPPPHSGSCPSSSRAPNFPL